MVVPSNLLILFVTDCTSKSYTEIPQKFQVPSIAFIKNIDGLTFPWLVLAAEEEIQHRKERNSPRERDKTHQDKSEGEKSVSSLPKTGAQPRPESLGLW